MAAKRAGADPPQLKVPPPPKELHFVLELFRHLNLRRRYLGDSPLPITDGEIAAWRDLHQRQLRPWEVDMLYHLDECWLETMRGAAGGGQV